MKISTFLATGLGVFLFAGAASAASTEYDVMLNGVQAGNAGSNATATATVTLNDDNATAPTLDVAILYKDFSVAVTTAHIWTGKCAEEGTVYSGKSLVRDDSTTKEDFAGTISASAPFEITTELADAIKAGTAFLTVSSKGAFDYDPPNAPFYEIRGQVYAHGGTNTCTTGPTTEGGVDAGTDSGVTITPDGGTTTTTPTTDTTTTTSGCNSTGSSNGSSGLVALGLGLAVYGIAKKRKKA